MGARDRRQRGAGLVDRRREAGIAGLIVADQHLAGAEPRKLAGKIAAADRSPPAARRLKCRARRARTAASPASPAARGQIAVRKLCAGRRARLSSVSVPGVTRRTTSRAHHGLGAALPRLGRVLDLLAHRDAMALRDQPLQIFVGGMHRHAAHRDVLAQMLAALGQRDAERARWRSRRPRRTARRNRPCGRTRRQSALAALISRYCAIIGVAMLAETRGSTSSGRGTSGAENPPCPA